MEKGKNMTVQDFVNTIAAGEPVDREGFEETLNRSRWGMDEDYGAVDPKYSEMFVQPTVQAQEVPIIKRI